MCLYNVHAALQYTGDEIHTHSSEFIWTQAPNVPNVKLQLYRLALCGTGQGCGVTCSRVSTCTAGAYPKQCFPSCSLLQFSQTVPQTSFLCATCSHRNIKTAKSCLCVHLSEVQWHHRGVIGSAHRYVFSDSGYHLGRKNAVWIG